jgi:predicted PurR-regulated permease PerM
MDTATQAIIYVVSLLVTAGFLALVMVLVPAIRELKALFVDLQKTSAEVRDLAVEMKKISANVEGKLDGIDTMLNNSQKIVANAGRAYSLLNNSVLKNAEWLALIPAILMGWKAVSKIKRRKDERQQ